MNEVLPLLIRSGAPEASALYTYGAWLLNVKALNGTNVMASSGVYALEKLTKCNDLHALTMLTWANVISKVGLLRETQAWCPLCFEDWRVHGNVIYYPLLWSLNVVKMCLYHQRILQERCPSPQCQKNLPIFATKIRSGYCPYCNYWLGSAEVTNSSDAETISREEYDQAYWNVIALGKLFEMVPHLSSPLLKEDLALAINLLIERTPNKKVASLAQMLNKQSRSIINWQRGRESPQLDTLLQMFYLLEISPQQVFFERSGNSIYTISSGKNAIDYSNFKKMQVLHDPVVLRRSLEEVLASEEGPSPSIQEVAQRLGFRTKGSLYKRSPELVQASAAKYQITRKLHPNRKMSSDELQQALETVLTSDKEPPPSIHEVALRLGYRSAGSLRRRFPELSRAIAARYRKHTPSQREPMSSDELRQALEGVLASDEDPPLSIHEVALRLGYRGVGPLRSRFPELSRAITAKHRKYSSNELRQVLEVVLVNQEEPPLSVPEVAQRLGYRNPAFLYKRFPQLSRAITLKKRNNEGLQQALDTLLESADPTITQQEIAIHLGCSIKKLHKLFPELRSILKRRFIQSFDIESLQVALEKELLSDNEPQSLSAVARSLGYPVRTLMKLFPSICQKIVVRKRVHWKMQNELREQNIRDEVQRVMLILHAEQKYPSLAQVLKLVDRSCVCPPLFSLEAYVPWVTTLKDLGYRK